MKDLEIDNYLAELVVAIDDLGGRVNLVGLCQGDWTGRDGRGLMQGKFMLQGWKNMHPAQHYIENHIDLYEHIDDPAYVAKEETF